MKARARVIGGFVRFGNRRDRKDAAAFGEAKGTGAPKAKVLLGAFAALAATLVLGVALAGAVAPVVTVEDADNVEYTTAHVEGEVNPEGHETSFHFEYITDEQYLANEGNAEPLFQGATEVGHGSTETTVSPSENLSGLQPATEYHLRLVATNNEGETTEAVAASTFTTKAVAKPIVSDLAASETHFSGMVNPNAPEAAPTTAAVEAGFKTHWSFTCSPSCSFTGPSEEDLEADNKAIEVSADPVNLTPNQTYDVTLHATNPGGENTETKVAAFTTPAIKPAVATATTTGVSPTSVVLNGTVNPHNSPLSDCHFAYGVGAALDQSAPCEGTLPSGEGTAAVHAQLTGLSPGTEYSFQLLATNPAGSDESATGHFGTPTGAVGASCPNEAIRLTQQATQTGDCRAWERVSPADKGGDIVAEGEQILAAEDGDGVVFASRYGFADTVGSGASGRSVYLGRRGAGGWSVHSITPQGRPDVSQQIYAATLTEVFSPDLSRARVIGYDLPGATGDTPERMNIYVEDTATGALQTVTSSQRGNGEDPLQYWGNEFGNSLELWGASDDLSHMGWESPTPLLPPGMLPGYPQGIELHQLNPQFPPHVFTVSNVYTWDDGTLHLAGILPDGSLPPQGSKVDPIRARGTMSANGSRQTFLASPTSGAPPQLYVRIDHTRTALISESENGAFTEEAQGVAFQGMTPDGTNVFFVTESPLLEEDEAPGPDLYRWTDGPDPEHESNLTLITNSGSAVSDPASYGRALVGMSDDASRVYVRDLSKGLGFWEEGSGSKFVDRDIDPNADYDPQSDRPGMGRVSPDGNWTAYIARPNNNPPIRDGGTGEIRLYDRRRDTVVKAADHGALVPTITNGGRTYFIGFRPNFLSNDGEVFFTSRDALVPEDTNGVADVYEYDGSAGELSLVTSGKGGEPMEFADASPDGEDVFFVTRAQLVPSDTDEFADLYDARAGGGFDEPQVSPVGPCSGEACQAAPGAPAASPAIGSGAATRGNPRPGRQCAKNKRKVRRQGKVRCVKRHHKGNAGAKRGGAK